MRHLLTLPEGVQLLFCRAQLFFKQCISLLNCLDLLFQPLLLPGELHTPFTPCDTEKHQKHMHIMKRGWKSFLGSITRSQTIQQLHYKEVIVSTSKPATIYTDCSGFNKKLDYYFYPVPSITSQPSMSHKGDHINRIVTARMNVMNNRKGLRNDSGFSTSGRPWPWMSWQDGQASRWMVQAESAWKGWHLDEYFFSGDLGLGCWWNRKVWSAQNTHGDQCAHRE